jgi:tRNA pseudouridine38-40 synthase
MKLKLTLEYDGTAFHGWARQPGLRTVEETVRDALDATFSTVGTLSVAGRTDAGVHATGQVASVPVTGGPPSSGAAEALNAVLPEDVAVLVAEEAPEAFDARLSARARSYRYRVLASRARSALESRRALWWPRPVVIEGLRASARLLPGEHDFRAFTPTETQHDVFVRDVEAAEWEQAGDRLELTITADSFLRHMVRTLVGTMLEAGAEAPARIESLLDGRPRSEAGLTAPPHGLYLEQVRY